MNKKAGFTTRGIFLEAFGLWSIPLFLIISVAIGMNFLMIFFGVVVLVIIISLMLKNNLIK